jgi:hypothetical protein
VRLIQGSQLQEVTLVHMTEQPPATEPPPVSYFERLRTPWWFYPASVGVAVLLGAEFALAVSGWVTWVPLLILLPAGLLVVWRMSSGRVAVTDSAVIAGDQQVSLAQLDRAIGLSATELRRLVGRHGDPTSFVFIRSWIGPGVQLIIRPQESSDPYDTVPYWVLSTRHPERLLAALSAASVPIA